MHICGINEDIYKQADDCNPTAREIKLCEGNVSKNEDEGGSNLRKLNCIREKADFRFNPGLVDGGPA